MKKYAVKFHKKGSQNPYGDYMSDAKGVILFTHRSDACNLMFYTLQKGKPAWVEEYEACDFCNKKATLIEYHSGQVLCDVCSNIFKVKDQIHAIWSKL